MLEIDVLTNTEPIYELILEAMKYLQSQQHDENMKATYQAGIHFVRSDILA